MKIDVYGRFQLDIQREKDHWVIYKLGLGTRIKMSNIVIPAEVSAEELVVYVDDLFHELSDPGELVRILK